LDEIEQLRLLPTDEQPTDFVFWIKGWEKQFIIFTGSNITL